jgi:hypothetical protein
MKKTVSKEKEFFVYSNSFAAPFFSDSDESFVKGKTAKEALNNYVKKYNHPCGLYAAQVYKDANAFHKGEKPLYTWLCNHEIEKLRVTKDKSSFSYLGHGPGAFEINGRRIIVDDPKGGKII